MSLLLASRPPGALLLLTFVLLAFPSPPVAAAQERDDPRVEIRIADSGVLHTLRLRDGSSITGRVTAVERDTIRLETAGGVHAIARTAIVSARESRPTRAPSGELWPTDPNATRLLFAPTGRMLRKGEGYFADHMLFFVSGAGGVTDRVTFGGGASVLPLENFAQNAFVVTPKFGLIASEDLNVAAGALIGIAGASEAFGILYGVGTVGGPDASVTAGLGYGFVGRDLADTPAILMGGNLRLSRRVSFVTENYLLPGTEAPVISYGLRFFGETLAVDMAFVNLLGDELIFPGIPFVGFAVHF